MIKIYSAQIIDFTQADYTKMYSLLECAIRKKIDAKKCSYDKKCSLVGYFLLYRAAYEIYGKTRLDITFNKHGKPLCDFCHFSISHSEGSVVCVLSNNPIGVDIQKIKVIKQRNKYKLFNKRENDYVNQNGDLVSKRYIEIFTKKEAAIKMLGRSLSEAGMVDTFSDNYCFKTQYDKDFILTVCQKNV